MQDQRLLREVSAGRGGKATVLFNEVGGPVTYDFVVLTNGGVMHTDGDGNVRWHPPEGIRMVIWEGEDG